jgi:hypothetical protein
VISLIDSPSAIDACALETETIRRPPMNTIFLLMAQYDGKAIIPVEMVRADYFPHLNLDQFIRKLKAGEIKLPLIRMEASQKAAKGFHLQDLAEYLDRRRNAARRELEQTTR